MKKVEIVSMQDVDNYGSVLQAYSLKKIIESFGCQVVFSRIEEGKNEILNHQCAKGDIARNSTVSKTNEFSFRMLRKRIRNIISGRRLKRVFCAFREETGLNNSSENGKFDICVIGSDEVFNCMQKVRWGFSAQLFGDVKNADKVITYAASCGFTKSEMLSEDLKREISRAIEKLSAISVRDRNTAEFVQTFLPGKYIFNLDPVAVGDFTEEIDHVDIASKLPAHYCIVYSYSNRISDPTEIKTIKNYCRSHRMEIVAPFGEQEWTRFYPVLTPFELLKAFQNAECIITDTFHGTLFGAKFGKRMAVLIRESNRNKLEDLTKRLQIEEHVVADISELEEALNKRLDREKIQSILNMERERTITYLSNNLT